MGITQVEKREAERFEEGVEPEFQDAEEVAIREENDSRTHESGASHGGFGSATLRDRLDRINQQGIDALLPVTLGLRLRECLTRRRL